MISATREAARIDPELTRLLACPMCRSGLAEESASLQCEACATAYEIRDGIPLLLVETDDHKQRQVGFFDEETDPEFEIGRPFGAPPLYRRLMEEKFRRAVAGLERFLAAEPALVVCGGSGMDAELLARAGARTITSDISLGAARRAQERARRRGLPVWSIVADAERLPFRDRSIPLVYVHDGLHHLERPLNGVAEMARVARVAVTVTEPADAAITRVAVRFGLALAREDAGNVVARLTLAEIEHALEREGFETVGAERYAMYYRHEPGRGVRALSAAGLARPGQAAWRAANAVIGRFGNKLSVRAARAEEAR